MLAIKPAAVINCAAYTAVDKAESEPEKCRAVNAVAVEHLVRACEKLDCPLVQISTDYVFGAVPSAPRPSREDDPCQPQGVYARTKLEGEQAAAKLQKHLIVRTCGLYARPSEPRAANFVKTMLRLGAARPELRIVDDQHCTPTFVPHLAWAILFSARRKWRHGRRRGAPITLPTPARPLGRVCRRNLSAGRMQVAIHPITTAEYGAPAARPSYSVLDTAAYHRLGGPAMPDWKAALTEYFVEWKQ